MRCQQVKRWLSAYDDGELSVSRQDGVQEHLHRCPDCQAAFADVQAVTWLVEQEIRLTEPPRDFAQNVIAALPSLQEERRSKARRQRVNGFAWSAATAVVVALGIFGAWWQGVQPSLRNAPPLVVRREAQKNAADDDNQKLLAELIPRQNNVVAPSQPVKKQPPRLFVRYRPKPVKSPKVGTPRIVRVAPAPRPARKPAEEIIETSPTLIVINLGTKEEQSLAADVRTVSSPQNVQRPRLTAELVSTDAGWGSTDSTDGG